MEGKLSTQNGEIRRFLPDVCQLTMCGVRVHRTHWDRCLFSPNCSKFAAECDWNCKISQRSEIGFFSKKLDVLKKSFSKSLKVAKFLWSSYKLSLSLRNVFSTLIVRFFGRKLGKFLNLEKLENMMEFFCKKRFRKASLTKLEGGKYSGGKPAVLLLIKSMANGSICWQWLHNN